MAYLITIKMYGKDCMLEYKHMEVSKMATVEKMIRFWMNKGYSVRWKEIA